MRTPFDTPRPTSPPAIPWLTQARPPGAALRRAGKLVLQIVPYLVALILGAAMIEAAPAPEPAPRVQYPVPTLALIPNRDDASETITILGTGFVPGGRVEILLYDQAGEVIDAQWTTATAQDYPDLSTTGPMGYPRAGVVSVRLRPPCGPPLRLRAWDQLSARWSTWRTYDPIC